MPQFPALELLRAMRSDVRADWKTPFKTLFFVLGHPVLAWRWTGYLLTDPMHALWREEPRLIDKPLRPYLNASWSVRKRVLALHFHYVWLARQLGDAASTRCFGPQAPLTLASWPLSEDGTRTVVLALGHCGSFEREGDLTLSLRISDAGLAGMAAPTPVVSLTFGVAQVDGQASLCIGCIQARKHDDTMGNLAVMTRAQHGMRPKALLIHVARILAQRWQLQLLGIDPACHPFASLRYQMSRSKRLLLRSMRNSYEDLWREACGSLRPDGWWALPTALPPRSLQSIAVRKRSMYTRRQQWLSRLDANLRATLATLES